MNRKHLLVTLFVAIAVGVTVLAVDAQGPRPGVRRAPSALTGTGFTYQGQLKNNGALVNATCAFQFGLWDANELGAQIGPTLTHASVGVTSGLFTVNLDFGANVFNGDARYLQNAVSCPSGGSYTALAPRQELKPAPMALALPGLYTQQNSSSPNIIGGSNSNAISATVVGATISGGGTTGFCSGDGICANRVSDDYGTIGGGLANRVGNQDGDATNANYATVGGGCCNRATGAYATIGGGSMNIASGDGSSIGGGNYGTAGGKNSAIGGGDANSASGWYSTIPGGISNQASMTYTLAAGRMAQAIHQGAFVWSDSSGTLFASSRADQFKIRASGGVYIANSGSSGLNPAALEISTTAASGVALFAQQNSSDSTLVVTNRGSGDLIRAFGTASAGDLRFQVDQAGNVGADGTITGGGVDFAEWLPKAHSHDTFAPGDVVGIFGGRVSRVTRGAEQVMVVSTKPAVIGGGSAEGAPEQHALVAFIGQVPTRVRGIVRSGDFIVPSGANDGTGVAVALDEMSAELAAQVIGRAMQDSDSGRVNIFVGLPRDAIWAELLQQKESRLASLEARLAALEQHAARAPTSEWNWILGLLIGGVGVVAYVRMRIGAAL